MTHGAGPTVLPARVAQAPGTLSFAAGDRLYFQCSACRYQCSLFSGTVFESSKLPLPTWFMAMLLMTQAMNNVAAPELMRQLDVSSPTAWLLKRSSARSRGSGQLRVAANVENLTPTGKATSTAPAMRSPRHQRQRRCQRHRRRDVERRCGIDARVAGECTPGPSGCTSNRWG
jgi:hypothetical protein